MTPQALTALKAYAFPGNVRELENILERALALQGNGVIDVDDLQLQPPKSRRWRDGVHGNTPLQEFLDEQERRSFSTPCRRPVLTGRRRRASSA